MGVKDIELRPRTVDEISWFTAYGTGLFTGAVILAFLKGSILLLVLSVVVFLILNIISVITDSMVCQMLDELDEEDLGDGKLG